MAKAVIQLLQCPGYTPPVCNLSASQKRRGGLHAGSDILSCAPSSGATPKCWHRNIIITYCYRSWFGTDQPSLLFSRNSGQYRLTEAGHSVDGGVFQALLGFVLSMCYSIDTTHDCRHACDHRRIPELFCGRLLRSGVATPPWRPWPWQCRSFNERSRCYFGSMATVGGEPICEICRGGL